MELILTLPSSTPPSPHFPTKKQPYPVVIHGVPDLQTPEEHEWWCPFGMQVEVVGTSPSSQQQQQQQQQLGAFQAALAAGAASRKSSSAAMAGRAAARKTSAPVIGCKILLLLLWYSWCSSLLL